MKGGSAPLRMAWELVSGSACQHTVRPGTFDVPHEDERTDGRKGWKGDIKGGKNR